MKPPDLQFVSDRIAIVDLLTQYWMHVDRRVWEPVKAIFVPGTLVDYSELMPIVAAAIDIYAVTVHNMGNCEVFIDGDTATAESVIVAHHVYKDPERQQGRMPVAGLRYRDRLVRSDAGWRVQHRRATTDWRAWWEPRTPTYVDGRHQ